MVSGTPLHVPWSFIYSGDSDALAAPIGTLADFANFWTNIFDINVSFSRTRLFRSSSRDADKQFFLLHALHDKLFPEAMSNLPDDERKLIDDLIGYPLGNSTDWSACRKKWRSGGDKDSVIYVFGHSDGKSIFLNNANDCTSKLDANGFSASFKKPADTVSKTICFINGCRSGAGLLGSGFLAVTSSQGFYGFIGSEAELSNVFAARYGAAFMSCLCRGGSVQEAFSLLRTDFFPLSLFYTCYAQPEFRLLPNRDVRGAT
jgi:hypothetical protein